MKAQLFIHRQKRKQLSLCCKQTRTLFFPNTGSPTKLIQIRNSEYILTNKQPEMSFYKRKQGLFQLDLFNITAYLFSLRHGVDIFLFVTVLPLQLRRVPLSRELYTQKTLTVIRTQPDEASY